MANINVEDMEQSIEKSFSKALHRSISMVSSPKASLEVSPDEKGHVTNESPTPKMFSDALSQNKSFLMHAIEKTIINQVRANVPDEFKHLFNKDKKSTRRKSKKRKFTRSQTVMLSTSFEQPKIKLELIEQE